MMQLTGFDGLTWEEAREILARIVVVVHRHGDSQRYYELHCVPLSLDVPEIMTQHPCYRMLPPTSANGPPIMGWIFSPVFERGVSATVDTYPGPRQGMGKAWLELKRCGFVFAPYVDLDDRNSSLDGT